MAKAAKCVENLILRFTGARRPPVLSCRVVAGSRTKGLRVGAEFAGFVILNPEPRPHVGTKAPCLRLLKLHASVLKLAHLWVPTFQRRPRLS